MELNVCDGVCRVWGWSWGGTMRKFWKEGKWEAGPGERLCREYEDENPGVGLPFKDVRPCAGSFW